MAFATPEGALTSLFGAGKRKFLGSAKAATIASACASMTSRAPAYSAVTDTGIDIGTAATAATTSTSAFTRVGVPTPADRCAVPTPPPHQHQHQHQHQQQQQH